MSDCSHIGSGWPATSQLELPIIALGDPWHDSAYAVIDQKGLRHVEVERYTRSKYEQLSPLAAAWMLDREAVEVAPVFLITEGPFLAPLLRKIEVAPNVDLEAGLRKMLQELHGSFSYDELLQIPGLTKGLVGILDRVRRGEATYEILDHHFCHAANAFLTSTFEKAIVFTLDGGGPHFIRGKQVEVHGSVYEFDRNKPLSDEPLQLVTEWSPGWAWTRMCDALGFGPYEAGTVMAMAAYGLPRVSITRLVRNSFLWRIYERELPYIARQLVLRHCRKIRKAAQDEECRFALARALQDETEARVRTFMAPHLEGDSPVDICLSGGVYLNCLVAGKIPKWFPRVRGVFMPPAPYDAGLPIGSAQVYLHRHGIDPSSGNLGYHAPFSFGPGYSAIAINAACRSAGIDTLEQVTEREIAEAIGEGSIIGLFQGGSESGRRALGNRSIIADPRDELKKDLLNKVIKRRQWFRPFAPMILHEAVEEWFDVPAGFESPYMSFAAPFKFGRAKLVPAVCHRDGTARFQTVHRDLTPRTHRILSEWRAHSGIPILLNTSFNDSEPIVETPQEAITTMLRSGINGIYFADFGLFARNPAAVGT